MYMNEMPVNRFDSCRRRSHAFISCVTNYLVILIHAGSAQSTWSATGGPLLGEKDILSLRRSFGGAP